ncbi:MAG: hypothetical protein ACTSW3_02115 [Promethearchaeota archaeon]
MPGQYEVLLCPFCEKGEIQCLYFPSVWSVKRKSTKTLPGSGTISKSKEEWIIQSGCPVCGKSAEEVEKELKRKNII